MCFIDPLKGLEVTSAYIFHFMQLTIQVGDVNDNDPVCPRLPILTLDRNADVGTRVVVLEVTDADIGVNAEILFTGIQGQYAPQFLEVGGESGDVVVSK